MCWNGYMSTLHFNRRKTIEQCPWNIQSMLATMDHTEFAQMKFFTLQSGGTAISFVQELDRQWNLQVVLQCGTVQKCCHALFLGAVDPRKLKFRMQISDQNFSFFCDSERLGVVQKCCSRILQKCCWSNFLPLENSGNAVNLWAGWQTENLASNPSLTNLIYTHTSH